ncbi:hypothetical protein JTB14_008050 [Gonioctena quinquepunctata]|nr:hypothetical protein JTB14_008050 [Gonioctena quinquepunctata]
MLKTFFFATLICIGGSARYGGSGQSNGLRKFKQVFAWKEIDYSWSNEETKRSAVRNGDYVAGNNLPLGMAKWRNKLFITVPRWRSGVPSALNYILLDTATTTAPLTPYPDWNTLPKDGDIPAENHIVSPFRIKVDPCDRLWVMDTGLAGITENPRQISPPAIVIFDLKTDKLIRRYNLKASDTKAQDSFFSNIIVDITKDTCGNAFAYIPDMGGYGLVVYSFAENDSWRIRHNYFNVDPLKGDLTIGGVSAQSPFGIISIALGSLVRNKFRTAYFHSLASTNEFSVSTEVLRNRSQATDPRSYVLFKLEGNKGNRAQTSASVFDERTNVLFLGQIQEDSLSCWNPRHKLEPKNVNKVATDHQSLIFINDITIDEDRNLWILSDRMPSFLYGLLNPNDVNYRIFNVPVDEAIRDTRCAA